MGLEPPPSEGLDGLSEGLEGLVEGVDGLVGELEGLVPCAATDAPKIATHEAAAKFLKRAEVQNRRIICVIPGVK